MRVTPSLPTRVAGTLPDLLARAVQETQDKIAAVDERESLTYQQLWDGGLALAAALHRRGVGPGDRIGLWLPNSVFWLQAHLAAAHLGAYAVGINARYPVAETARIAAAASVSVLVVDVSGVGLATPDTIADLCRVEGTSVTTVVSRSGRFPVTAGVSVLDGRHCLSEPIEGFLSQAEPQAPLSVFASSGSTGTPKLILHNQAGACGHSFAVAASFGYTEPDAVVLGQLPLCGVWGFTTAYGALAGGATVVLMDRFDAGRAVDLIERYRVTSANGPDLFLRQLFAEAHRDPARVASLREIGFSTFSNDGPQLVAEAETLGIALFQVYGSSEQQALMVRQPVDAAPAHRAEAGGQPIHPAIGLRVRDADTGTLLPPGAPGLLETRGPNLMTGYLTPNGTDTRAFTDDGWLRTGDIAVLTEDGMRYLSRAKDVLRLSGFLVEPQEIERHLEEFAEIAEAQVVGIDTARGPRCVAFVRQAPPAPFDEAALLRRCRGELASFKVPHRIFQIDNFPRIDGANGPRIQRLALRDMAIERLDA